MIYTRPDYFSEFHCIADKCPQTCCAGWQIVIDDSSLQYYKKLTGAYADVLRSRIDFREGCFHQDHCKRCAFLKEDNLCDMYEHLGEESLCLTCTNYPRHIEEFENIHNYISDDNMVRKGSISAKKGERSIIPLNMRDGSLLCTGKGNPDWNYSAPHGAGRVLSRTQAYEQIKMEDFEESMKGIYSESVNDSTRDESPMAYKPADEIIANIADTVSVDNIIKPIFNFKAS